MGRLLKLIIVDEDINNPGKQYRQKVTASKSLNIYSNKIQFVEGYDIHSQKTRSIIVIRTYFSANHLITIANRNIIIIASILREGDLKLSDCEFWHSSLFGKLPELLLQSWGFLAIWRRLQKVRLILIGVRINRKTEIPRLLDYGILWPKCHFHSSEEQSG